MKQWKSCWWVDKRVNEKPIIACVILQTEMHHGNHYYCEKGNSAEKEYCKNILLNSVRHPA